MKFLIAIYQILPNTSALIKHLNIKIGVTPPAIRAVAYKAKNTLHFKVNARCFIFYVFILYSVSAGTSLVQCGHFVAFMSISLQQYGHFLVVGFSSTGFLPNDISLLISFTNKKITKAIIRKLITAVINLPYAIVAPLISNTSGQNSFRQKYRVSVK